MFPGTQYRGMYLTVLVTVVIGLASLSGGLKHGQDWLYDQFVNLVSLSKSTTNQVVIVEVAERAAPLDEADWILLLNALQTLGASQVVLSELPRQAGAAFFDQVRDSSNVVIGRTLKSQNNDDEKLAIDAWPALFEGADVPFGVMAVPVADHGISRSFAARVAVDDGELPSLAVAAARARGISPPLPPGNEYLINFNDGRNRLPRISADHVLDNALIPELFAGRTVLIGAAPGPSVPGIHTPINHGRNPLSLLEFQGYALDTLLDGKAIRVAGPVWLFGLLLITAVASLFIYQWFNIQLGGWFTVAMLLLYWGVGWCLLHYLYAWGPILELTLSQIILYLLIARLKVTLNESALRKLIADSSGKLHASAVPDNFYTSPEHWTQVITLVDQVLHLRRLIFLEKVKGDHRVREVKALNCSIDVIDERRRDYERTPYSTAIAEGGPILLEKSYLKPLDGEEEDQYLVPLIFAGEVLGFWAFGVAPVTQAASARFLESVAVFANQISELLYHRSRWLEQQNEQANVLRRFLRLEVGNPSYPHLRRFLELAHRRVSSMEAVFNGMDTAAIVYDLFGRVLQLNRRMEDFMRTTDLPGYELTALDLLVRLTDSDRGRARQLLREVVMDNGQFHLPVTDLRDTRSNFILGVRAVTCDDNRISGMDNAAPFQISGLLFELINVSQLQGVYAMKDTLVERFGQRLRAELAAIVLGSDLLREKTVSLRDKARAARVLRDKVSGAVELINQAGRYMQVKVAGPGLGMYPVDAAAPVLSAMKTLNEEAQTRDIRFSARLPEFASLVCAAPEQLGSLMRILLETLVNDAAENTTIEIDVEERDERVIYQFRNTGFGIPNERFQAYLFGGKNIVADEFKALHDAINGLDTCDGRVSASSEVGTGMAFNIELQAVI
jgi:CHASE2 domain-containing sensor protein/PAS domain-containing protein